MNVRLGFAGPMPVFVMDVDVEIFPERKSAPVANVVADMVDLDRIADRDVPAKDGEAQDGEDLGEARNTTDADIDAFLGDCTMVQLLAISKAKGWSLHGATRQLSEARRLIKARLDERPLEAKSALQEFETIIEELEQQQKAEAELKALRLKHKRELFDHIRHRQPACAIIDNKAWKLYYFVTKQIRYLNEAIDDRLLEIAASGAADRIFSEEIAYRKEKIESCRQELIENARQHKCILTDAFNQEKNSGHDVLLLRDAISNRDFCETGGVSCTNRDGYEIYWSSNLERVDYSNLLASVHHEVDQRLEAVLTQGLDNRMKIVDAKLRIDMSTMGKRKEAAERRDTLENQAIAKLAGQPDVVLEKDDGSSCLGCELNKRSVFMSCGHVPYCNACALRAVVESKYNTCPMCKKEIDFLERVFL